MIQRIQTIFLFLVGVSMLLMLIFPLWSVSTENETQSLYAFFREINVQGQDPTQIYMPFAITGILAVIAAGIAFFEISRFKNRILQMKLGFFNSLVMASTIGLTFWFSSQAQQEWITDSMGQYMLPGFMLPAIAMLFNIIANRFIRKDENLVRSVDRLR